MAVISSRLHSAFNNLGSVYVVFKHSNIGDNAKCPFRYSIDIPLDREILEFPLLFKDTVIDAITKDSTLTKLTIGLDTIREYLTPVKTADTMVSNFFNAYNYHRLSKYQNGKGNYYYGHKGIILDNDFNPLMCIFYRIKWNEVETQREVLQPILKVSPWVFNNQQEFMAKAIIQKIIPLSLNPIYISSSHRLTDVTFPKYKVVIEDMDNLITSPTPPPYSDSIDDDLNQILIYNISDLDSFKV